VIIANLNDYRGYECSNDVGFECGMAFQLGKRMYGYMDNAGPMKDRVPHLGEEKDFRDFTGENFDYPINLMFACSMPIFEGKFENVIQRIAEDLNT
jgi:nucleoside 2-deoxyribosyltransferase